MEWFDALDDKCKMEAILAGHVQTMQPALTATFPINAMHARRFSNVVVISRHTSNSSPCCERIGRLAQCIKPKPPPPEDDTPSRYRSPSPEPTCCGLINSRRKPEEIYA